MPLNLRSKTTKYRRRASTQVLFLRKAELAFFHFLEIVTGWLVPSPGQKIPVQPGWYLPLQKIPQSGNSFLQVGKGAENTKEKFRAVLYVSEMSSHTTVLGFMQLNLTSKMTK